MIDCKCSTITPLDNMNPPQKGACIFCHKEWNYLEWSTRHGDGSHIIQTTDTEVIENPDKIAAMLDDVITNQKGRN